MNRGKYVSLVMDLEIKRFITVEDQDKASQLVAESFY